MRACVPCRPRSFPSLTTVFLVSRAQGTAELGATALQQSGIVFLVDDVPAPKAGTFHSSCDAGGAACSPLGLMGAPGSESVLQEMALRAFEPLVAPERPADRHFVLNLTGDNGFMSMNSHSYTMPPEQDLSKHPFEPNPYPLLVRSGQLLARRYGRLSRVLADTERYRVVCTHLVSFLPQS